VSDDPLLRLDDKGDDVRRLQQLLVDAGFDPGPVDGIFGSGTDAAVRAFQAAKGLDVDGLVGRATWAELRPSGHHRRSPTRSVSDKGLRLIERFEGLELHPYNDSAGHCTVGIGHLLHHGNCDGSESSISTPEAARRLLGDDADEAGSAVSTGVTVDLNQAQFDALVSFVFNVGPGAFEESTLRRLLNEGSFESVPPQLNRWIHSENGVEPGLVVRRDIEGRLFRDGTLTEIATESVVRLPKPVVPPDGP